MIILHNSLDKGSREFVANHGEGLEVIDWYREEGKRTRYLEAGYPPPSSFPSLVDEEKLYIFQDPEDPSDLERAVAERTKRDGGEPPPNSCFDAGDLPES